MSVGVRITLQSKDLLRLEDALDAYEEAINDRGGDTQSIQWWIEDWREFIKSSRKLQDAARLVEEGGGAVWFSDNAEVVVTS